MLYSGAVWFQEIKMSIFLIAPVVAVLVIMTICHTTKGVVSPGIGLLLKVASLQRRESSRQNDVLARRAANEAEIRIIDGRPDFRDGVLREDLELKLPGRSLPARLYRPGSADPQYIIVSYHGGGFVVGSLDTNERLARDLCRQTKSIVLSVGYRLAPEHTFPAAHDDAVDSLVWVQDAQAGGRLPSLPVWVSGDSAGANLAAAVCFMARSRGGRQPAGQLLFYPVTDVLHMDTESYRLFGTGYLLTRVDMEWFIDQYLEKDTQRSDPRISPLLETDFVGLPPALVLTAGKDVLRDEGEAFAGRLKDAGVVVELHRFSGMVHGFVQMRRFSLAAWRIPGFARRFMQSHTSVQALHPGHPGTS
jgi:acetyl esterase